jgi:hypothetical protein
MIGTLFGLIVLIYGLVLRYDPEAQFPPAIPRMPSWWPLNMTWGGLPASVPPGYIAYFVLPAVIGAAVGRRLSSRFGWRRPITLLNVGFVVGFLWATNRSMDER